MAEEERTSRVSRATAGIRPSHYGRRALAVDVAALALTALLVTALSPTSSPTGGVPRTPLGWLLVLSAAVLLSFVLRGMYRTPLRLEVAEAVRAVLFATALAGTVAMTARVLIANDTYVAAETVRYWLVAVVCLTAGRSLVLWREARARRDGEASRRTLIIGSGKVGKLTAERLLGDPELGLRPVAFLDDDPLEPETAPEGLPILGEEWTLERTVRELGINHVIIAFSRAPHQFLLSVARDCWRLGVSVSVVPRLFEIEGERVVTEHLGGLPLIETRPADPRAWQFRVKYALDRVVAAVALALLAPVLLAVAVAVKLSAGGPVIYRQRRVGRDGHTFEMLKFRTLRDSSREADAEWADEQLEQRPGGDYEGLADRFTPVGAFLRRHGLDELPQLWNVLRGDMSLIGPRPERVSYVERFERGLYRYGDRHRVKSGMTGWAQVNGLRGNTSLADRTEWDNHYIENWSLWLDLKILLMTVAALLRPQGEGAALEAEEPATK
jgi:exopolysaccharide biosynthesis polyprenyl glycosylphosphotransferase